MKGARFIVHNQTIQSYQLEEYRDHYRRMDEIESTKASIYKSLELSKQQSHQRFQMLQNSSKFNKQQQMQAMDKLQKLLDTKIERINKRDNPFFLSKRIRAHSQVEFKSSPNVSVNFSQLENANLFKKLSNLKPNICKKDQDSKYEKQKAIASRLRKSPKLPSIF